ncbi:hypothetical protein CEQ90_19365 [Lewinellaceae bacterium SD302]|nr:hypothetical protein CEQ90_19365 [Lewinellaceae bacterium SD302]
MLLRSYLRGLAVLLVLAVTVNLSAQLPELTFTELNASYSQPVAIVNAGDGSNRLFIVDKEGFVNVYDLNSDQPQLENFFDLSGRVSSFFERGLLGMAFHPDFAANGQVYVHYSAASGTGLPEGANVVSRFTLADPAAATLDISTEEVLLVSPQDQANHNGGDMAFGPDGYLYVAFGDGGGGGDPNDNAQNPANLMGTIIRIDVDTATVGGLSYGIPQDNPFADGVAGRPEIYAYGLRNPWRFSFDRQNGNLWIADVGQSSREEINLALNGTGLGKNYGWDCLEGNITYPGNSSDDCIPGETYELPILDIMHSGAGNANSITGGYVYRGTEWPELQGLYFSADYVTNNFFILQTDSAGILEETFVRNDYPTSGVTAFGESENGELFVASIFSGLVHRIGGGVSNTRQYFNDTDFKVAVSPNPATNMLRVDLGELTKEAVFKLSLVDSQGRTVLERNWLMTPGAGAGELRLPDLPAGVYQLVVDNGTAGRSVRLVIQ